VPRRGKGDSKSATVHLLDTNVIIRFLIGDDPPKAARAIRLMERVERGLEIIEITEGVLTEAVWTLDRYYKVPRDKITQRLIAVLSFRGVRMISRDMGILALQHFADTHADFVDCLLTAESKIRNIPIYAFDETDFPKLGADWNQP